MNVHADRASGKRARGRTPARRDTTPHTAPLRATLARLPGAPEGARVSGPALCELLAFGGDRA